MEKRRRRRITLVVVWIALVIPVQPFAQDSESRGPEPRISEAVGFTFDLLPPVMSAAAGEIGLSGQAWYAREHVRFRLVGAGLRFPDAVLGTDDFRSYRTNVMALITDYTFGKRHNGPWIGAGLELWMSTIEHEATGVETSWNSLVATVGGGYIWRLHPRLYLEPWGALHVATRSETVEIGSDRFEPRRVSGEVSLKVGWIYDF